jgi:hypothetical protein
MVQFYFEWSAEMYKNLLPFGEKKKRVQPKRWLWSTITFYQGFRGMQNYRLKLSLKYVDLRYGL